MALGVQLSPIELAALESLDPSAVHHFATAPDPRLQKALLVPPPGVDPGQEGE